MDNNKIFKPCVIIPIYNHAQTITALIKAILVYDLPCIVVDDGSSIACAQELNQMVSENQPNHIRLLRHEQNYGKGRAVMTGLQYAFEAGYTHALQIDADGQHNVTDIPHFLNLANDHPLALILGCPQYDNSVPKQRLYARYLTHIWVWINTLSLTIKDSMCGFRVYPLSSTTALIQRKKLGSRMDFDSEIAVRLHWQGVAIINVPTRVTYPPDGISHFRLLHDNLLISRMHAILFFEMLWHIPALLMRKFKYYVARKR